MRLRELFKQTEDRHPNDTPYGPEFKPTMPAGTVRVDVSDVYDWYKLGMHISDLKGMGPHDFGQGPPSTIMAFGSEKEEHDYIKGLKKIGLKTVDIDPKDPNQPKNMPRQATDPRYNVESNDSAVTELFEPGKTWQWEFTGSEEAIATFHVGKVPYMFHAYGADGQWEVEFKRDGNKLDRIQKFGLTGTGNSAEVMGTVVDIMRAFLDKYKGKLEVLIFSAKEDSRQGLYAKMIKRLLPTWTMRQHKEEFVLVAPKQDQVDEAELDPKGWGETPMGTDVDYFGLQVQMKPSTFLMLAAPLGESESNADVEKHMAAGGKIAYPFLDIKDPVEWEEGNFKQPAKVVGHEGRNRMKNWIKLHGDTPIQVNIFLRNANRRRYITDDMISALNKGVVAERSDRYVSGPLFKDPQ